MTAPALTEPTVTGLGMKARIRKATWIPAVATAVILFVLGGFLSPGYATWQNLNDILAVAAILAIAAAGQTLVIIAGDFGIDLSIGAVMSLTAVLAYMTMAGGPSMLPVALLVVVVVGAIFGFVNGLIVTVFELPALVVTLGTLVIASGLTFAIAQGGTPAGSVPAVLLDLSSASIGGIRPITLIAVVLVGLLAIYLRRSRFGQQLLLVGSSREAARLSGIPVRRVVISAFVGGGVLAGIAGILLLGYAGTANLSLGADYQILTISAAVIGGAALSGGDGNVLRTAAGAVALQVLTTFLLTVGVGNAVRQIVTGLILLVLLLANSRTPRLRA
ncbi:ABC transporter permease [Rhodococcus sp. IEGM 1381]|uniref:ABC transporter permease n=1 Tax=Rhodococcus sp. IEGM 1381 TaxID=3047085 RepID=UPI0024B77A01|nr:ABC transporter permease [Rhodococcus sp. IEGM 1381]MDI9894584.1 ABC transporter permease [Rhodococcus sp. IEGM 1381]